MTDSSPQPVAAAGRLNCHGMHDLKQTGRGAELLPTARVRCVQPTSSAREIRPAHAHGWSGLMGRRPRNRGASDRYVLGSIMEAIEASVLRDNSRVPPVSPLRRRVSHPAVPQSHSAGCSRRSGIRTTPRRQHPSPQTQQTGFPVSRVREYRARVDKHAGRA